MMTRLEAGMRNLTRLAEAQAGDSDGHTVAAVLKAYVDCFLSQTDATPLTPNDTRSVYLLFFDGGSRGNPGPGGTGSIIVRVHKDSHTASLIWAASMAYSRKDTTNNFAEYWGLIHGLREAQRSHFEPLYVIGDSALIISQQRMHRSPRQHRLARLYQTSRRLADCIDIRGWYHHYRAFNKMADSAANLAMDTRTSTQVHFPTQRAAFNNLTQDLDNDVMHWLMRSSEDPRSLDNTRQPHIGPREHAILVKDYLARTKMRSLFQQPEYLHAVGWKAKLKAATKGFLNGLEENHKLMSIIFKYNEHFSRVQHLTIIFTVIMSQMFTNALLYKLKQGPKSKGSAFVAGVISSLCIVPVTIAFVAMFKKAARRQNYLVRYQVEDDEGNVADVETDAYGKQREYSPDEILSMDLAAIANCVDIPRIQKVAVELKRHGINSKNRGSDEEPPETDDSDKNDPLKGILAQIKSHLQIDFQELRRPSEESRSRISSILTLGKRRSRAAVSAGPIVDTAASDSNAPPMLARKALTEEERQTLAINQLLLMLGRDGGEGMVNDMLKLNPLEISASSGAKITEISHESWVKQQSNAQLIVAKAKLELELERTESQLKKLQYAIGAQFERRLSGAIARAEDAMLVTLRAPVRGSQAGVVVHLPTTAERKQASEQRISRSSRKQQGPSTAQLVPDSRLIVTIKQEKNALLKANQEKLKEKRAAMAAAQRKMHDEQRKLQQDAKRELQKLMDGLHGVAKMKKKLQLHLEACEE
ncbi:Transmembrane protein, partial [Globisporangium splendens]